GVELGAEADKLGHVGVGAELADQPRRVPRGAAGELAALQQDHVAPAEAREVIRGAAADDAAADDDRARVARKRPVGHHARPAATAGRQSATPISVSTAPIASRAPRISASPRLPIEPTRKLSATVSLPG